MTVIRPNKIIKIIHEFISLTMKKLININLSKLNKQYCFDDIVNDSYSQSSFLIPLIFILPSYFEPYDVINAFANKFGYSSKIIKYTIGACGAHLDEINLTKLIKYSQINGDWLLIENFHIASRQTIAFIENIYQDLIKYNNKLNNNISMEFRLWLSSRSTKKLPIEILENSIKITCDEPITIKQTLIKCYHSEPLKNPKFFSSCPGKDKLFSKMLYSMAFFHGILREKRNFGIYAWNVNYNFNHSDFVLSINQLKLLLSSLINNNTSAIKSLKYLIGNCNYCGNVINKIDKKFIMTIFDDIFNVKMMTDLNYSLLFTNNYFNNNYKEISIKIPNNRCEYRDYTKHIDKLSQFDSTKEIINLLDINEYTLDEINTRNVRNFISHFNMMTFNEQIKNTTNLIDNASLATTIFNDKIIKIKNKLYAKILDIEKAQCKYPIDYLMPINTILIQEIHHYNIILNIIDKLLLNNYQDKETIKKAIIYHLLSESIINNENKDEFINVLTKCVDKINQSFDFLHKWINHGFPQYSINLNALLLSSSQSKLIFSIKTMFYRTQIGDDKIDIDKLVLKGQITNTPSSTLLSKSFDDKNMSSSSSSSFGIENIYLLGAMWDFDKQFIIPSQPKIIWTIVPLIICYLHTFDELVDVVDESNYLCPLYKSINSTDNHDDDDDNDNFIDEINLLTLLSICIIIIIIDNFNCIYRASLFQLIPVYHGVLITLTFFIEKEK